MVKRRVEQRSLGQYKYERDGGSSHQHDADPPLPERPPTFQLPTLGPLTTQTQFIHSIKSALTQPNLPNTISMASRLDRLFILLETGSTQATRRTAAQQLGTVARSHPQQLPLLLTRVAQLLHASSWETRIAAGAAVRALIIQHTKTKGPPKDNHQTRLCDSVGQQQPTESLAELLPQLLDPAPDTLLMAAEGASFDRATEIDERKQRELLQKQIYGDVGALIGADDVFGDENGTATTTTASIPEDAPCSSLAQVQGVKVVQSLNSNTVQHPEFIAVRTDESFPNSAQKLSTRQLNTAKRRAKQRAAPSTNTASTPVEKRPKPAARQLEDVPGFLRVLLEDLQAVDWETRHGAATGLREVIIGMGEGDESGEPGPDLLPHLLRVLALDRFSDFVSDQLVAPVRETAGQALGALLPRLREADVEELGTALVRLLEARAWETRHGALIGLKYLLTLRGTAAVLRHSFDGVLLALSSDHNDDVSAAAAAALQPIVPALVAHIERSRTRALVQALHRALETLDDLSAASCNVMELLAALLEEQRRGEGECGRERDPPPHHTEQQHAEVQNGGGGGGCGGELLGLLLPFLHHKSSSVRRCALQSLLSTSAPPHLLPLALRHLFERALLETEDLHALIHHAWTHLIRNDQNKQNNQSNQNKQHNRNSEMDGAEAESETDVLECVVRELLPLWLWLAVLNPRIPIPHEPAWLLAPPSAEKTFIASGSPDPAKVAATRLALARLLATLPERLVLPALEPYLQSTSGLQRTVAALVVWFWGTSAASHTSAANHTNAASHTSAANHTSAASHTSAANHTSAHQIGAILEHNLSGAVAYEEVASTFTRLQTEARDFLSTLRHYGVGVGLELGGKGQAPGQWLSLDQVGYLGGEEVKALIAALRTKKTVELLEERRRGVESAREEAVREWRDVNVATLASTSAALLALPLPLPTKLSPLIKPLIDAVRSEPNATLQQHAANAIVRLVARATPKANSRVLHNLIQSLNAGQSEEEGGGASATTDDPTPQPPPAQTPAPPKSVEVRGAEMALEAICRQADVEACGLWALTVGQLLQEQTQHTPTPTSTLLTTLNFILPHLPPTLHHKLPVLLPTLLAALPLAARTVALLCQLLPQQCMAPVVESLLDKLRSGRAEEAEGAVRTVQEVVEALGLGMLPWVVLLVVPVLTLMSSPSPSLRPAASLAFAALIRLLPLESAVPPPPNLPPHLAALREEQRDFLDQLLNPAHIAPYEVEAEILATLRPYQQAGVNWLGFLRRFGLHGILCDDMGLGKTLMCICLLAEEVRRGVDCGEETPPSLVVCPPTLTGHWVYEMHKFAPSLTPLHYHGAPAERSRLQARLSGHNVVIASYDIVRNDLDFFCGRLFHYCVLDEGHVIKNGRTKLSRAIKQLRASHRLILTGTPIQNHVLELHSLFDFLMPGFLGSERVFAARFARPILAARDAKCSDREAEAGALAMEALHRQALPFLLRRLKEDVLGDLPPKITQDYFCALSPLQALLYEDFAKTRAHRNLAGAHATRPTADDFTHIFQSLQYLRKVCNHPKLVLQGHPRAPEILAGLKPGEIDHVAQSGKLQALKQLLTSLGIYSEGSNGSGGGCGGGSEPSPHRALIFCQLKSMLDIVEKDLLRGQMGGVTWLRLDGSVPAGQRQALVERFNTDVGIDLLLLTTQVGGLGLNLTGADTVVFVEHDWNPMRDLQAMDRAHRIGQTRTVNVYRLITRGTLEEKIMGLQKFKLLTAQTVIGGENKQLATMRTDTLLDLFTLDAPATWDSGKGGGGCGGGGGGEGTTTEGLLGAYRHVIEAVPELWDEKLYDDEYDLSSFIKSLK